ncbi:MAG: G5 domain-containing protein [bacterium]|nr:G5 domain-containing protein [bacterium]
MNKKSIAAPESMNHGWKVWRRAHPLLIPVVVLLFLFFATMVGLVFTGGTTVGADDKKIVNVFLDDVEQTVPTRAQTVGELLEKLDINLRDGDTVEPRQDSAIFEDDFDINIYRAREVVIEDGKKTYATKTATQAPRVITEELGLKVYEEDIIEIDATGDVLESGFLAEKYVIDRAIPVRIILYGNVVTARTQSETVRELLLEKGIELQENDTLSVDIDSKLKNGLEIIIAIEGQIIETVEEDIPFKTETIDDPDVFAGESFVKTPGVLGKKIVTYDIKLVNGKEDSRKVIQEVVAEKPVKEVVVRGTKVIISDPNSNRGIGQTIAASRGFTGSEFYCLDQLWTKESNWRTNAGNPTSGAYGIPQSLPGEKMASVGSDWRYNPATQIKWGLGYIEGRYGSPCGAWAHSQSVGWY